ncbi:hypothetical protein SGLAD_v1c06570 [Spiroplasma gladiatoris]|uniref:UvrD-like helicase C-terminal domain-containing protein n=1 Tax=Spiroplasma gladiatoris TaxID=2143 RepID=A0A4P7AJL0_9MOLU|nr:3'-5' exonuclease [Spiroplasma gladiatoris]QBQ07856.1 hypothetical protein SGLAD_v1c06570 [Spiroplasma gladiatoris]
MTFNLNKRQWVTKKLSTSYRITSQNAKFLNDVYFKEKNFIKSTKKSKDSFVYLVCNVFEQEKLYSSIINYISNYKDDEIFILSNTLNNSPSSPLNQFIGYLSNKGHLIHMTNSKSNEINKEESKNKIIVSTIHKSKGREKKLVIVFNFNNDYFDYFAKNEDSNKPTNLHYVALSRATHQTIIINHYKNKAANFLSKTKINSYLKFNVDENFKNLWLELNKQITNKQLVQNYNEKIITNVTSLFNNFNLINILEDFSNIKKNISNLKCDYTIKGLNNLVHFTKIKKDKQIQYLENVSSINGIFFPLYFQNDNGYIKEIINYFKDLYEQIELKKEENNIIKLLKRQKTRIKNIIKSYDDKKLNLLELVVFLHALNEGKFYRINQIKDMNWISEEQKYASNKIFEKLLSKNCLFEVPVSYLSDTLELSRFIDCIDIEKK